MVLITINISAQDSLSFKIILKPKNIPQLPALHSYAFAQHEGKCLIVGGRLDGLHARQPFNAFPASANNRNIFVLDPMAGIVYSKSIENLPQSIKEQLQSTNMNFYQDGDLLIIAGGYAFAESSNGHITFPNLMVINVPEIIQSIISSDEINPFISQIEDERFAVTGGAMGKLGDQLMIIGGHRFDGRYNPMNNPTFAQTYTNEIRKFALNLNTNPVELLNYETINDPIHLHRRDYNLVPVIFEGEQEGYMISAGVFQLNADLPFLYPVDIKENGINPRMNFNQYLSHYHSPKVTIYDGETKQNHTFFFGGMSQYYYENGQLIQDNQVPFVKSVSMVTRFENDSLVEYLLPIEMPAFKGSGAEFIINMNLSRFTNGVIKISEIEGDSILLGYIYGGIRSNSLNPFSANQTNQTQADGSMYEVILVKKDNNHEEPTLIQAISGNFSFDVRLFPNPNSGNIHLEFNLPYKGNCEYFITDTNGRIVQEGTIAKTTKGRNKKQISVYSQNLKNEVLILTLIFDNKHYASRKILFKYH
ncbi:MAG: hypothetical protein ACK4GL_02095 [Flavobacteriales bacterium]